MTEITAFRRATGNCVPIVRAHRTVAWRFSAGIQHPADDPPLPVEGRRMTVIRSASASRIDCDDCAHHTAAPSMSIEDLRRTTGYVSHRGRDFCPSCWYEQTALRFGTSSELPTHDDSPAA